MRRRGFFATLIGLVLTPLALFCPGRSGSTRKQGSPGKKEFPEPFYPCDLWAPGHFARIVKQIAGVPPADYPNLCVSVWSRPEADYALTVWLDGVELETGFFWSRGFAVDGREAFNSLTDFKRVIRSWKDRAWSQRKKVGLYEPQEILVFDRPGTTRWPKFTATRRTV